MIVVQKCDHPMFKMNSEKPTYSLVKFSKNFVHNILVPYWPPVKEKNNYYCEQLK